jgi:hypothetical protein
MLRSPARCNTANACRSTTASVHTSIADAIHTYHYHVPIYTHTHTHTHICTHTHTRPHAHIHESDHGMAMAIPCYDHAIYSCHDHAHVIMSRPHHYHRNHSHVSALTRCCPHRSTHLGNRSNSFSLTQSSRPHLQHSRCYEHLPTQSTLLCTTR